MSYGGHVWRLTDKETGTVKAVYAAPKEDLGDVLVVNEGMSLGAEQDGGQMGDVEAVEHSEWGEFPKVFVKGFNVWAAKEDGEHQITRDATADNPYDGDRVYISPDGHYAVVWQYTPEQERKVCLVESSPKDQLQPKVRMIQYIKPGDRVRVDRPRLFDLVRKSEVPTDELLFRNPYELINIGWSEIGREYRFVFNERGHQHLRVIGINQSGHVRLLLEESSKTFIDYSNKFYRHVIHRTGEFLWMSERSPIHI